VFGATYVCITNANTGIMGVVAEYGAIAAGKVEIWRYLLP
jgi:hypothetical protein